MSQSSSKLTSRTNYSESGSSGCLSYADSLANKLISLHEENLQIGKQNQELSAKLHEVTNYNQALGLDIYQLDNEINELEIKIETHKEKTSKVLKQTEIMNRKTESCKTRMSRNEQMVDLAARFKKISRFKDKADKNVKELQEIFDDPNISRIASSFDIIAEKIHFLYWNNNELNEQLSLLEKLVTTKEDKNRSHLIKSWEDIRIDKHIIIDENEIKEENRSESCQKGGASLRVNMRKRSSKRSNSNTENSNNNNEEENVVADVGVLQSDASKKNEYFMSSDSIENEMKRKKKEVVIIKPKVGNENQAGAKNGRKKRRCKKISSKASNRQNDASENEYDSNEYSEQKSIQNPNRTQFDANQITPRKRRNPRKCSDQTKEEDDNEDDGQIIKNSSSSPQSKSSSTTYSKSSSKSNPSEKSNQQQSPTSSQLNDTSSQMADSSNSNHSNHNEEVPSIQLFHNGEKFAVSNYLAGCRYHRRRKRKKENDHPNLDKIKDSDSEYDYYESEPPPNPKKGTKRVSRKDPEYEYEYYDPDDENEMADDENDYDFIEENTEPPKVIVSRPKDFASKKDANNDPVLITTYTEGEYNQLNISKPKSVEVNKNKGEKFINISPKYEEDDDFNSKDKSEYIYIKKSAKSIKEDEMREKQRKLNSNILIKPKVSRDEMRKQKNEVYDEEQIKKYEENALRYALEDEIIEKQKKIKEDEKLKNEEEDFLKNCLKSLKLKKKRKIEKWEKMKDDEILSVEDDKDYEKFYIDHYNEVIKIKEERELIKAIEEEDEVQFKKEIRKKAKKRIQIREKEEEELKEKEEINKMNKKEAEEKILEQKRIKARKFKEEELKKLKDKENEENQIKINEQKLKEELFVLTQQKEKEKEEKERNKREKEESELKERERIVIEEMTRRQNERDEKERKKKEIDKQKHLRDLQILKDKINKFRELKEKEKIQMEESKNNEKEIELIKQKLRIKRRKDRELREKERIEREKKDRELRELYEGIFDVPVKRIFDKNDKNNDDTDDIATFRNSRLGNDKDGFLSDDGMSTSDSMAELDVADPVALEEDKLATLHDKNTHSHSNCKRVKVRKNDNEYEYEYEYEYDSNDENDDQKRKNKNKNNKNSSESESDLESIILKDNNNSDEGEDGNNANGSKNKNKPFDEKEAELIALKDQERLQKMLQQIDNKNSKANGKNKRKSLNDDSSTSRFESDDSSIAELSRHSSPKDKDSLLNYNYEDDDENSNKNKEKNNSDDAIEYSDDDFFPKRKNLIKVRNNKNNEEGENEELKNKSKSKNGDNLIIDDKRPLRKKKAEKAEFVPEYYNPKQQPKFKPIVVASIDHDSDLSKSKSKSANSNIGDVVETINNPEIPKPIVIDNCKIRHPKSVQMDMKDFEELKTKEQLRIEAEEKARREEREKLHAERAKKFRHSIDANGKEYEYDYEYDYEYETDNNKDLNNDKNNNDKNDKQTTKSNSGSNSTDVNSGDHLKDSNNLHATHRDSTDFYRELTNKVESANAVVQETVDALKRREEEEVNEKKKSNVKYVMKDGKHVEEEEEENEANNEKEKTKVKRVRTGRKIKKVNSSNDAENGNGIRKQRSVHFNENNESQVNFNPSLDADQNRTPPKRMINSARRQRNSPISPSIPSSISPNQNERFSTRRHFRDTSCDNNEEEELIFDENDEDEDGFLQAAKSKTNNLLVEIDSRPDTPRKAAAQQEQLENEPVVDIPSLNLKSIVNGSEDEYEYEYEYETQEKQPNSVRKDDDNSDEDFTENEKAFGSRSNYKLHNLVRKVREDASLISNEDLQDLLGKINSEVELQLKSNEELKLKLQELEKIRDHKQPKTFSVWNNEDKISFEPVDTSSNYGIQTVQTDVTGEFIGNIESTLLKQSKEKQEMVVIQKRIEAAQQQVISIDSSIKTAEKLSVEKKQSIENLKKEIMKVKEEIAQLNYDSTQDDVQAKQCEIEIEKLDTQVQQSQKKLVKVSQTIEDLQIKLQEMINYRSVLEAELNDMYNREKPEVRKLIEDVRNSKQFSEDAQMKMIQIQKKLTSKRDDINKIKSSQDKKKSEDLRLVREKLARRLNKWSRLVGSKTPQINEMVQFSIKEGQKREKAKLDAYKNMKKIWIKDEEVDSLSKYADLLESLLSEYNKQNPVT